MQGRHLTRMSRLSPADPADPLQFLRWRSEIAWMHWLWWIAATCTSSPFCLPKSLRHKMLEPSPTNIQLNNLAKVVRWCLRMRLSSSRMRSKGSRFTLRVWGLRVCSLDVAFTVATVRNRSQPPATVRVRTVWPCLWEVLQEGSFLEVSDVWLLRFAWQAWHFVTFSNVL